MADLLLSRLQQFFISHLDWGDWGGLWEGVTDGWGSVLELLRSHQDLLSTPRCELFEGKAVFDKTRKDEFFVADPLQAVLAFPWLGLGVHLIGLMLLVPEVARRRAECPPVAMADPE